MFFTMGVLLKTNNMKISEVIKKLQEIQKEEGDLYVIVLHDGFEDNSNLRRRNYLPCDI